MAARKLTPKQRDDILKRLAERQPYAVIASQMGVTIPTISSYYDHHRETIERGRAEHDAALIERGLAGRDARIARLDAMAQRLEVELTNSLYYDEIKVVPGGGTVEQPTFSTHMVKEWRGLLSDLADEMGHRKKSVDLTSNGKSLSYVALMAEELNRADSHQRAGDAAGGGETDPATHAG